MSSRTEDILKSILDKEKYTGVPQSRVEELLIEVGDLIEQGGASPEQIEAAVDRYLDTHPVSPYDDTEIRGEIATVKADLHELSDATMKVVICPNKFDKSRVTNETLNANGTTSPSNDRFTTDYIEVVEDDIVYYTIINSSGIFFTYTDVNIIRVCFYDSDKNFISTITFANSFVVPTNAKYLRGSVAKNPINSDNAIPSITFNDYPTLKGQVVPYFEDVKEFKYKNDIKVITPINSKIIECWGDSRTEMTGDTSYPLYLQNLLGDNYFVSNYGISSQSSGMVNARLGANEVFVTFENNQINASGSSNLTSIRCSKGNNRNLFAYSNTAYIPCIINGISGRLSRSSIASYSGVKFLRDSDGSAVNVKPNTRILVADNGSKHHACILWWGKNDFDTAADFVVSGIEQNYDSAVEFIGHDHFIILGETCSIKDSYLPNGTDRNKLGIINQYLVDKYPNNYIDINSYLSSTQALADVGLTPTSEDLDYISKGFPCYQLMQISVSASDTVHPNAKGREAIAKKIHQFIVSKGW